MDQSEVLKTTKEYLDFMLKCLNLKGEPTLEFAPADDGVKAQYIMVKIVGDGLNELVGFHGKNMESFQNILSLMVTRKYQTDFRILLEVNDYREKREKYLQSVAERASMEVISTGQDVELPPMKPFERRVIHMFLKTEEGIKTESVGEGEDRRIVIKKA